MDTSAVNAPAPMPAPITEQDVLRVRLAAAQLDMEAARIRYHAARAAVQREIRRAGASGSRAAFPQYRYAYGPACDQGDETPEPAIAPAALSQDTSDADRDALAVLTGMRRDYIRMTDAAWDGESLTD